jgi:hypothetical protein
MPSYKGLRVGQKVGDLLGRKFGRGFFAEKKASSADIKTMGDMPDEGGVLIGKSRAKTDDAPFVEDVFEFFFAACKAFEMEAREKRRIGFCLEFF